MKKHLSLAFDLLISLQCSFAQQIDYKVTYDNPGFVPFWNLNLSYLDIDIPFSNFDAINFNAGI